MNSQNNFLFATQNPKAATDCTAPTNDLTPTVPKVLTIVQEITVPGTTGDFLMMYCPYSTRPMIQLFQRVIVGGSLRFVISANYLPDQDLNLKYNKIRTVSGYVALVANTITTTNSNLSGSVNMVLTNNLPRFSTLTPSTLSNIANMPKNFLNQAKLSQGVVNLFQPSGRYKLRLLSSPWSTSTFVRSLSSGTSMTRYSDDEIEVAYVPPTDAGWDPAVIAAGANGTVWLLSNSLSTYPNNLIGRMRVSGSFMLTCSGGSASSSVPTVALTTVHYSSTNFVAVTTQTTVGVANIASIVSGTNVCVDFTFDFESCTPLADMSLLVSNVGNSGSLTPVFGSDNYLRIELFDTMTQEYSPVVLNTITGVSASQVISFNMFTNYDAVPDPSLNQDIKPKIRISDITEIDVARYLWALDPELRAVYTDAEFGQMIMSAGSRSRWSNIANKAISNAGGGTAAAADWGGFLSALKSIGKVALNVVPGVIGAFNPGAGVIASNVANAIAPAFATEVQRGYSTEFQTGYSSSATQTQHLPKGYAADAKDERPQVCCDQYDCGCAVARRLELLATAAAVDEDTIDGFVIKQEQEGPPGPLPIAPDPMHTTSVDNVTHTVVVPPVTKINGRYHCTACDKDISRTNEGGMWRGNEHLQTFEHQRNTMGTFCGAGVCQRARSHGVDRAFPNPVSEDENVVLLQKLKAERLKGRHKTSLDAYTLMTESGLFCKNCLNRVDIDSFYDHMEQSLPKGRASDNCQVRSPTEIAERMRRAAEAYNKLTEPIVEAYASECASLRETAIFTEWLKTRQLKLMSELLGVGASPDYVRRVLSINMLDPSPGRASDAATNAAALAAKYNKMGLKPKEATQAMKEVTGVMDFDKAFGGKPNAGLSQSTLLQLNNFSYNPTRTDVTALVQQTRTSPASVWWTNRCIIVSEGGDRADNMTVAVSFVPVGNKRDQKFEYIQYELNGVTLFVDNRLESQGPEVVVTTSPSFAIALATTKQIFLTARLPTTKEGKIKFGSIVGHSWYMSAYACQHFASDTILYTGSSDNRLGDIGDKIVHSLMSGMKILALNCADVEAQGADLILRQGGIEGIPKSSFLRFPGSEPYAPPTAGYYLDSSKWGADLVQMALAASVLLSGTDTKWQNLGAALQKEINMEKYGTEDAKAKNWKENLSADEQAEKEEEFEEWWAVNQRKYEEMSQGKGKRSTVLKKWMQDDTEYFENFEAAYKKFGSTSLKPKSKVKAKTVNSMSAFRDRFKAAQNPKLGRPSDDDDNDDNSSEDETPALPPKKVRTPSIPPKRKKG